MPAQASPLNGSIVTGEVSAQPLPLSMSDALDRALHYNLAILSGTQDDRAAAAMRLRALYEMYPKINADITATQEQINLAAFGFTNFPGIAEIVGPFGIVDARAKLTESVFNRKLVHDLREAQANENAATYANANSRELVVLTVANLYLQALASASRVTAVEAQVGRAQALYNQAVDLRTAGVIAGIEVVRAQVELQTEQQRLLAFRNDFAQQKLSLSRAIGIPLGQELTLTDHMPTQTTAVSNMDTALLAARNNRADMKRADALVTAAQQAVDSARSERLPTLDVNADYGAIGPAPDRSHGTYSISGEIKIPIFNGTHEKSDREVAAARLEQRRLEAEDLKGRIEMDVRSAFLELQSSSEQVRVAQSSLDLAHRQLDLAQDRFQAGVTGNLEVVQAQEAVALADESVISGLYSLNVAKAMLARAEGIAEQAIKAFLGGTND